MEQPQERLQKWDDRARRQYPRMEISGEGLTRGAGMVFAKMARDGRGRPRLALADAPRALALLPTANDRPVEVCALAKHRPLVFRDPPDHPLRRLVITQFTPERVRATAGRVNAIAEDLIGKMRGREKIDLAGDFAYPCLSP